MNNIKTQIYRPSKISLVLIATLWIIKIKIKFSNSPRQIRHLLYALAIHQRIRSLICKHERIHLNRFEVCIIANDARQWGLFYFIQLLKCHSCCFIMSMLVEETIAKLQVTKLFRNDALIIFFKLERGFLTKNKDTKNVYYMQTWRPPRHPWLVTHSDHPWTNQCRPRSYNTSSTFSSPLRVYLWARQSHAHTLDHTTYDRHYSPATRGLYHGLW